MYQVLIWGADHDYNQYINLIKYQEAAGNFSVVGITGEDEIYDSLDGYHFIPQDELKGMNVDFIIVTSKNYYEISNKAAQLFGNIEDKLILARVFALPEFEFSRYVSLMRSHISIFAFNCWGGLICHALGLPFRSPSINMFFNECGYLELMHDPKYYLGQELWFQRYEWEQTHKSYYPICKLGNSNIELHFNHYDSFKKAEEAWYKRIPKINWSNLFVMMCTSKRKNAEEFDELDYKKKICFVPFESSIKSSYYLQVWGRECKQGIPISKISNDTASGVYQDYDRIALLLKGKVESRYYAKGSNE